MGIKKRRLASNQLDVIAAELLFDHLSLTSGNHRHAMEQFFRGRTVGSIWLRSVGAATPELAVSLRERTDGFAKRLARDGPPVQAGATHRKTFFHHRRPFAEFGRLNRGALTGRTTPDAHQIKIIGWTHKEHLLCKETVKCIPPCSAIYQTTDSITLTPTGISYFILVNRW
jgi:hypothetical protein